MAPKTAIETVKLTIDGHPLTVPKGTLVIEAARQTGVMVPHFCYHPKLKPDANCRMCLVEVEKMPKLQTACSTPVAEGMVVRTATTVVNDAHKSVLEFILANHPLDCPVCDQGGRCDLQDFSHEYTPTTSRFVEIKRVFPKDYFSPVIETQMNRCVQCLRCVRYCDEVVDAKALAPVGRGTMTEITHFGERLNCDFCGGCVQICPVGAITSRLSMYEFRPWMLKRSDSTCGYCGDGCTLTFQTKENQLIEVNSAQGAGRNNGDLCARGFFGYHANTAPERLTTPLIRRHGELQPATWDEALDYVAATMAEIKLKHGPQAFAGLIAARCTNEELYLFQKFMRLAIGTNKLDSSARYGQVNAVQALRRVQGTHRWTVTVEDIAEAEVLLLVGTNITETNPVTGLRVKEAVKKRGAALITVEALEPSVGTISNIVNLSAHRFTARPGAFKPYVLGLLKGVVEENLVSQPLAQQAPGYVQGITGALQQLAWPALEAATGSTAAAFKEAARAFARTASAVVVIGPEVLRAPGGAGLAATLLDLLLLTGHHGRPGSGLAPLAEENNDQGAVEMGAVTEFLPGPSEVTDQGARARIAAQWREDLPQGPGRSLMEIIEEARSKTLKALYVVGENPAGSLPDSAGAAEALEKLDFLLCQELFLTETAKLAHVVLPACSYAEKDGTFTNTEGHVQAVRHAIEPLGDSRPDWEIFSALSVLLGYPLEYGSAREILKEIRSLIPGYALLGPAPTPPQPDQAAVDRYLREGHAGDLKERYGLTAAERAAPKDGFTLELAQSLYHSGKFSTHAKGLLELQSKGSLAMSPADAERLGIAEGDRVRLSNERGALTTTATIKDRIPAGVLRFPEHFDQEARRLLAVSVDPATRVPYYRQAQVTVEKI